MSSLLWRVPLAVSVFSIIIIISFKNSQAEIYVDSKLLGILVETMSNFAKLSIH